MLRVDVLDALERRLDLLAELGQQRRVAAEQAGGPRTPPAVAQQRVDEADSVRRDAVLGQRELETLDVSRLLVAQPAWKSNSELGYGGNLASMAWKLYAIEQMQLRGRRRVDGVGRPKFDFHTGSTRPVDYSRSASRPRRC